MTCFHLRSWETLRRPTSSPGELPDASRYLNLTVVLASTLSEDTSWLSGSLSGIHHAIYVADDTNPERKFRTPMNKGNEAMAYLTYIIDHYDRLPDVSVFMHAHLQSKHTDDLLGGSAIESLQRLRKSKVAQDGYFNMRCNWKPGGCPNYLNLHAPERSTDGGQQQAEVLRTAWIELFPERTDLPMWSAQAYGAQFAASRDAIRRVPLDTWRRWRDWLIKTELSDYHSGRVWEYTWQFVLSGTSRFCPAMHTCYCEGYAVCFKSEHDLQAWRAKEQELNDEISEFLKVNPTGAKGIKWKESILRQQESLDKGLRIAKERGEAIYKIPNVT